MVDKSISPYTVIVRPVITEKSTDLAAANKYIFEVDIRANKPQIKQAIETAFEVTVVEVNTMVMKGKPRGNRRFGRKVTYGTDWKKAIVTLAADDKIELFEGV
ncbi:MAG: 50S ribosomal protein L23 [Dehalococcoidia bacterium]